MAQNTGVWLQQQNTYTVLEYTVTVIVVFNQLGVECMVVGLCVDMIIDTLGVVSAGLIESERWSRQVFSAVPAHRMCPLGRTVYVSAVTSTVTALPRAGRALPSDAATRKRHTQRHACSL